MPLVSLVPPALSLFQTCSYFLSFPLLLLIQLITNWLFLVLVYVCSFSLIDVFYLLVPYVSREKFPLAFRNPERVPIFISFLHKCSILVAAENNTIISACVICVPGPQLSETMKRPHFLSFFLSFFHKCSILMARVLLFLEVFSFNMWRRSGEQ